MDQLLYVYSNNKLDKLKEKFNDHQFNSLSLVFQLYNGNLKKVSDYGLTELTVIDITNFFSDTQGNRWHRGVLEEWISELKEVNEDNVIFIIYSDFSKCFFDMYPFLFDKVNNDFLDVEEKTMEREEICNENIQVEKIDIYTYNEKKEIKDYEGEEKIINFSQLIKDFNGLSFSFDSEGVSEKERYYVEITSLIKSLEMRRDQIFSAELMFYKLKKLNNIKFLIHKKSIKKLFMLLPFFFNSEKEFSTLIIEKKEEENISSKERVDFISKELNQVLQGHPKFKENFKTNLLKFFYLNKIKHRKMFSIFICGKSGIGKTNFATSLSEIMYPGERQIKLNFGNYSTEGVLNSLIGSPLGYIGSEQGGELTNKVKGSESKVILIDEFEKADKKVFNFFYELLEDGKFTDRAGNEHNLNEYIIIFTSNLDRNNYTKVIPEPLNSRFDMKFNFEPLKISEKIDFIKKYSEKLVHDLNNGFGSNILLKELKIEDMFELSSEDNLREIKRKVEDEIFKIIELEGLSKSL